MNMITSQVYVISLILLFVTTIEARSILDFLHIRFSSTRVSPSCSTYSDIPLVDPVKADIRTLTDDLSKCRYSSSDLVRWYISRIEEVNEQGPHPLHAVIEINPDALDIADALDIERQINGTTRSSLHGIPILIKDNIATDDKMETTSGSLALVGSRVPRDAFVVERLRKAGAIILGKASLSEWSNFKADNTTRAGWSARGGLASSAYVADGNPGGSSSGSAIATSAGLCAAAIGTETCGSTVVPTGRANIVGLKPTVGLTSRSGVIPLSLDHDTVGPMGKTVEDVARLLEVIQSADSRDNMTQKAGIVRHQNYTQFLQGIAGLRHLRLGVVRQGGLNMSQEKTDRVQQAIDVLRLHGAIVIDPVNVTGLDDENLTNYLKTIMSYNFRKDLRNYLSELRNTSIRSLKDIIEFNNEHADKEFHEEYSPNQDVFLTAENRTNLTADQYAALYDQTQHMGGRDGIDATLNEYELDALIVPDPEHEITVFASFAGYPLIVVPLGFNQSNNEPYGLMFAGTAWSESTLLRVAHGFEQAFPVRDTIRPKYAERHSAIYEFLFKIIEYFRKLFTDLKVIL
ncbi:unnamed protein product [Adineta ricciae]|uniref:Amidase domain-containing protein n=1 Tax=Adineta ricciae TaxID=249248 RepID=A0A814PZ44_ADIRI|nr:unnamed protein product [Adineta ricciae]